MKTKKVKNVTSTEREDKEQSAITMRQPLERNDLLKACEEIMPAKVVSIKGAALSIVNNKNGKRVKVATGILDALGHPDALRFLVRDETPEVYILAAQADEVAHKLAGKPTKNVVYSAGLVERLTSLFELDYSSRTSHSIGTWMVTEEDGMKMIGIRLADEGVETSEEKQEDKREEKQEEHQKEKQEEQAEENQQPQERNEDTYPTTPFSESVAE